MNEKACFDLDKLVAPNQSRNRHLDSFEPPGNQTLVSTRFTCCCVLWEAPGRGSGFSCLHWCRTRTDAVPSGHFSAAAASFIPEVRHAPHPLGPLRGLLPSLHVLRHRFKVTQARPGRRGWRQSGRASEGVDLDAGPEVDQGHARGRLVPLAGESLGFLLLLQLIQNLQEEGAKQAGHFLHIGLVGLHDLPEPEQEGTGSGTVV